MVYPTFDFTSFCTYWSTLVKQQVSTYFTNAQATGIYNNEALLLGNKVLSIININNVSFNAWDASSNSPTLVNGTGTSGTSYLCTVAGTVNFGAGDIVFNVNDTVVYNGSIWTNQSYPLYYYWTCIILAHILQLNITQTVGRIGDADEGTVKAQMIYPDAYSSAWWEQTVWGAMIWQLIKQRGGATLFKASTYNGYLANNCGIGNSYTNYTGM